MNQKDTMRELMRELGETLFDINSQIDTIKNSLSAEKFSNPYGVRTPKGDYILTPLLAAKAQVLSAMISLRTSM